MANRTDDFSGSGTLNGRTPSDGGSAWVMNYDDMTISGGRAHPSGNNDVKAFLDTGVSDGTLATRVIAPNAAGTGYYTGLYFRGDSAFTGGFVFYVNSAGANLYQLGTGTIGSANASFSATDPMDLSVVLSGSSITCKVGGVTAFSATVSTFSSNTRMGLTTAGDSTGAFEDFTFTAASTGATTYTAPLSPTTVAAGSSTTATITPDASFTGTITGTPSGSASTGLSAIVTTFSGSATAQTATWTPTVAGTLTITWTNSASLVNPASGSVTVNAPALTAGTASFVASGPAGISGSATAPTGGTGTLSYQWERNGNGGAYADVSGATSLSLSDTTATTTGVLYGFRCKQTRGAELVTTNTVTAQVYSGGALTGGGLGGPRFNSPFLKGN
jgi:hypothetical protein